MAYPWIKTKFQPTRGPKLVPQCKTAKSIDTQKYCAKEPVY